MRRKLKPTATVRSSPLGGYLHRGESLVLPLTSVQCSHSSLAPHVMEFISLEAESSPRSPDESVSSVGSFVVNDWQSLDLPPVEDSQVTDGGGSPPESEGGTGTPPSPPRGNAPPVLGTESTARIRRWCFTWHDFPADWKEIVGKWPTRYICCGVETCPTTGRIHLQGYLEFKHARTFSATKSLLGGNQHLEPARGDGPTNRDYCSKEGDFWEQGLLPKPRGQRSDLITLQKLVDDNAPEIRLWKEHFGSMVRYGRGIERYRLLRLQSESLRFTPLDFLWYCGSPGTGKSSKARQDLLRRYDVSDIYVKSPNQGQSTWFDGIPWNVKAILFDEFCSDIRFRQLCDLTGGFSTRVECKGSSMLLTELECVIVTSNYAPWECYPNLERKTLKPLYRRITKVVFFPPWSSDRCPVPEDRTNELN